MAGTVTQEFQDQLLATVRKGQEIALEAIKTMVDTIQNITPKIPSVDMPFSDKFAPPLTTVRIPHHEMGLRAAELLLARIGGESAGPALTVLPAELVVRRSTAPRAEPR